MQSRDSKPDWLQIGREARAVYDDDRRMSRGDRAALRRCGTPDEIQLEGAFYQLATGVPPRGRPALAAAACCYPACKSGPRENFRFGSWLHARMKGDRRELRDGDAMKFRRLLSSTDLADLTHQLRRTLTQLGAPIDWGALTRDLYFWSQGGASRDRVRRAWAQDFYAGTDEALHSTQEDAP